MVRRRSPRGAAALLVAAASLLVLATAAAGSPGSSPSARQPARPSLEALSVPFEADDFPAPVDIAISRRDLAEAVDIVNSDPARFDGLVIGVQLEGANAPPGGPGSSQVQGTTLSRDEVDRIIGRGGPEAEALDRRLMAALRAASPPEVPEAPASGCFADRRPWPEGVPGIHLACRGDEPITRFVAREFAEGSPQQRLHAALTLLADGPTTAERATGLYSLLEGADTTLLAAQVGAGGHAVIDVQPALIEELQLDHFATASAFLEQVVNTAFNIPEVRSLEFTLQGDCAVFWSSLGGDDASCPIASRDQPRNEP